MSAPENRRHDLAAFRSVYLVARREFVIRVRSRVYRIITTLIVLVLIVAAAVVSATIHVHTPTSASPQSTQRAVVGVIVTIVLFISLQAYGIQVAQGVAEEKESRIVEILLSTIRPDQLLAGKVIGIGLVGILQVAIVGVVGLILIGGTHVVTIPVVGASAIAGGLLWFVLGFTLYAVLFAAAGSLVSRVQDVQLASLPIPMALAVAYVVSLVVILPDPNSLASTVLSLVPFVAPVAMPARLAAGAPAWQVGLAVVLTLVTIAAAIRLAARIYANSVLRTGARVTLREALHGR